MKSVKPGLSLIEVIIAILILGIATTSLLGLQGVLIRGVFSSHALLDRIGFIRSFFVEANKYELFKKGPLKIVLEDPLVTMSYTQKRPISKGLRGEDHLVVDQIDAEWPTAFGMRKDIFSQLMFRPQKEKKS